MTQRDKKRRFLTGVRPDMVTLSAPASLCLIGLKHGAEEITKIEIGRTKRIWRQCGNDPEQTCSYKDNVPVLGKLDPTAPLRCFSIAMSSMCSRRLALSVY